MAEVVRAELIGGRDNEANPPTVVISGSGGSSGKRIDGPSITITSNGPAINDNTMSARIGGISNTTRENYADFLLTVSFLSAPTAGTIDLFARHENITGAGVNTPAPSIADNRSFFIGSFRHDKAAGTKNLLILSAKIRLDMGFYIQANGIGTNIPAGFSLEALTWST